jgi:hypothetical protein
MESPPPTADGVYSLYSVEFYQEVRRVLRPGGLFMQFLPLYLLTPLDTRAALHTMVEVFPQTFVAKITHGDFVLLGYSERPKFEVQALRQRSQVFAREWASRTPPWSKWAPRSLHPIASFEGVAATLILGPAQARGVDWPPVLHDDRQLLSYSNGDRWLARRYAGRALINLSFAALPLSDVGDLAGYFEPPLSPAMIDELTLERLALLEDLNVRDPRITRSRTDELEREHDPARRAGLALAVALDHDAALHKADALRYVEIALAALRDHPQLVQPEQREAVRKIVRNRIAVYAPEVERRVDALGATFEGSPLYAVMREELEAYRVRQAEAAGRYLLR